MLPLPVLLALSIFAVSAKSLPESPAPSSLSARSSLNNGLSPALLSLVKQRLAEHSTDTWVSGTRCEALLELEYPSISVFSSTAFPVLTQVIPTETNDIIAGWYAQRPSSSVEFVQVDGGASADPASLGVAWTLARFTADESVRYAYDGILHQEANYLRYSVPRTGDGAISHRPPSEPVQLWADFVYMVPPYLAYYGVIYNDVTVMQDAYDQCRLYRQYLRDPTTGLWKHIVLGNFQDYGYWGTGNAWAAAGMTRVIATLQNSQYAGQFSNQINDLASWVNEILTATFSHVGTNDLLPNYYTPSYNSISFSDASSSALLAATAYRISTLGHASTPSHVSTADAIRLAIYRAVNTNTGWLSPVVDPLSWSYETNMSPEGQAFVILMEAAFRDYQS